MGGVPPPPAPAGTVYPNMQAGAPPPPSGGVYPNMQAGTRPPPPQMYPGQYQYAPQRQAMVVRSGEDTYCGPISLIIGLCVPCWCWICLCPIDRRPLNVGVY